MKLLIILIIWMLLTPVVFSVLFVSVIGWMFMVPWFKMGSDMVYKIIEE